MVPRYGRLHTTVLANTTNYTDTTVNLFSNSYQYRVVAFNAAGNSVSNTVTIGTPPAAVIYEAENATYSPIGVVTSTAYTGYSGTGFADYTTNSGSYIEWTVNVATAGQYALMFRYALASGNRPLAIRVNGVLITNLGFPATGSWTTWSTVSLTVTLNAGTNTVRATTTGSSGANIDSLQVF
jgi:hypothetical protein